MGFLLFILIATYVVWCFFPVFFTSIGDDALDYRYLPQVQDKFKCGDLIGRVVMIPGILFHIPRDIVISIYALLRTLFYWAIDIINQRIMLFNMKHYCGGIMVYPTWFHTPEQRSKFIEALHNNSLDAYTIKSRHSIYIRRKDLNHVAYLHQCALNDLL